MKNYKVILGIAALALVFGLVLTGCPTQVEGDVGIKIGSPAQVETVTVTPTANKAYYIVSWKGVGNASNYTVYYKQDGKETVTTGFASPTNQSKYETATGTAVPNEDADNWAARIVNGSAFPKVAGSYRFGVKTNILNSNTTNQNSDIKWSEPFTLTEGAKVTIGSITPATKTVSPPTLVTINISGVGTDTSTTYYGGSYEVWRDGNSTSFNGALSSGQTSITFTPDNPGTYKVKFQLFYRTSATGYNSNNDLTIVKPEVWTPDFAVTSN
ncbi:hypothetical protein AGMMS50268_35760 [Spirochaetia bacterium]|nr:hypothetical protein AGMMS50268_35760 [Spirochaetia bacterium]